MKREEQILKRLTEQEGGLFYDTALRAMREFAKKQSLPPAEGAETIQPHITCPKCSSTNNSELAKNDRLCYDCNHSWSEQQPPAEGAEEIAQRCPVCMGKGLVPNSFYATTSGIGSTTQTFLPEKCRTCNGAGVILPSYFHAQKIADKMVSERLREELIRWEEYCDDLIPNMPVASDEKEITIAMIDLYLNNRSI